MGDTIYNYGNGNIVNQSNNVQINNPQTQHKVVLEQLQKLSQYYSGLHPEDESANDAIGEAITTLEKDPDKSIKPQLVKFGSKVLEVAKDLSLDMIVKLIKAAIGLE